MDNIKIEILADGTIKSTTDAVSPENHSNAEAFLKLLSQLTGGPATRQARGDLPTHHHHHVAGQEHTHGGHTHTH
jgi:hypothetical protein